jgi:hypothetical protein
MKKVLVASAALLLAGGIASTASAAKVEPGVKITGDARVRMFFMDDNRGQSFGNNDALSSRFDMDSRIRLTFTGTTASGVYAKTRLRIYESPMGAQISDSANIGNASNTTGGVWVDMAYVGIPFSDNFTLEIGKYRSTFGPLSNSYNFFYDDVLATGFKGIIKFDNVEINPFFEWAVEAQNQTYAGFSVDPDGRAEDNDVYRFGVHAKAKVHKDWTIGGTAGYQIDKRNERPNVAGSTTNAEFGYERHDGFFGSIYVNGKYQNFGLVGELAVTNSGLNNFNAWESDPWAKSTPIGSEDTGWGGYIFPNFQIDKLNIGLNLGFTSDGYMPDLAFGDGVLLGSTDNSVISAVRIGDAGDWLWAGLVVSYQFREDLKLTGNFFYAEIDAWETKGMFGDGPNTSSRGVIGVTNQLEKAWTISAILQYTLSKGTDVYFSAGYLKPYFDEDARRNKFGLFTELEDDGHFAAATRLEIKF